MLDDTGPASTPGDPSHDSSRARSTTLAGDVRTVSLLTLLSRFGGLVRDAITIRVFGDTAIGSAFSAAFQIPNLFRRLFGEGALAAAFLPEYARAHRDDPDLRDRLASLTILLLTIVTGALTILGELILLALLLFAPGSDDRALSFRLMMVMLPFMPLVCTAAILGAMLQVHGRFIPAAGAPIILNIFMIAGALLHYTGPRLDPVASAYAIGISVVASGVVQALWCAHALRGHLRWRRDLAPARATGKRILRRFIPVVIGLGTIQINTFIDTLIAMWPNWVGPTIFGYTYPLDEGSNAVVSYTQRLYQFPLGVFGIAVATAAFPLLSRAAGHPLALTSALRSAIRLSLFIGIPASVGLMLVRYDITYVMFGGGAFSDRGVSRASHVLLGFAVAIWAYSLNHVLVRVFYAHGNTRTPMNVALASVALNFTLNVTLIWSLGEAGLAWSTAISQILQTLVMSILVRRYVDGPLLDRAATGAIARMCIACAVMYATVQGLLLALPAQSGWSGSLFRLSITTAAGLCTYIGITHLLGVDEWRALIRRRGRA